MQVLRDMQSRPWEGCSSEASTMSGSAWAGTRDEEARGGASASNGNGGESSLDEVYRTRLEALKEYKRRNGKTSGDAIHQMLSFTLVPCACCLHQPVRD